IYREDILTPIKKFNVSFSCDSDASMVYNMFQRVVMSLDYMLLEEKNNSVAFSRLIEDLNRKYFGIDLNLLIREDGVELEFQQTDGDTVRKLIVMSDKERSHVKSYNCESVKTIIELKEMGISPIRGYFEGGDCSLHTFLTYGYYEKEVTEYLASLTETHAIPLSVFSNRYLYHEMLEAISTEGIIKHSSDPKRTFFKVHKDKMDSFIKVVAKFLMKDLQATLGKETSLGKKLPQIISKWSDLT
ncbi:hypothetical protein N9933_03620, partial [bacterium]|nr:hypothetical protein [bacterium]